MGISIRIVNNLALSGLLFFMVLTNNGEASPVTVAAQPVETVTLVTSVDPSSSQKDEQTDDAQGNTSATTIIIPPEADGAPGTTDTKLALSQLEQLRKLRDEYNKKAEQTKEWSRWTCVKHGFRLGSEDPALIVTKKQLAQDGYFSFSSDDSEEMEKELTPVFDEKLEKAVMAFQKYHLLDGDGVIGPKTCRALNLSPVERLKKIELNIKRWEQLEPSLKGKYILVNIPTYNLYAIEEGSKIALSQPVIVGLKNRQTPLFTTPMVSVILNPSWGVPVKIFVEDKLKKVLEDPNYLEEHHYTVIDRDGQEIPANDVDWSHVSKHYFPYTVRQSPGKYNALGNIKFNLHNKDAIYMHGTPQVDLFSKAARAFSSGCIRLSAPRELAAWVLEGTSYNSVEKIEEKIETKETITVPAKHIPVHFVYVTVWVDGEGKAIFSDDPYQLD